MVFQVTRSAHRALHGFHAKQFLIKRFKCGRQFEHEEKEYIETFKSTGDASQEVRSFRSHQVHALGGSRHHRVRLGVEQRDGRLETQQLPRWHEADFRKTFC